MNQTLKQHTLQLIIKHKLAVKFAVKLYVDQGHFSGDDSQKGQSSKKHFVLEYQASPAFKAKSIVLQTPKQVGQNILICGKRGRDSPRQNYTITYI